MPTRNVELTDSLDAFIQTEVASGGYRDASDVVRDGLRLLQHRRAEENARLEALRQAAAEGLRDLDAGVWTDMDGADVDGFVDDVVRSMDGERRGRA